MSLLPIFFGTFALLSTIGCYLKYFDHSLFQNKTHLPLKEALQNNINLLVYHLVFTAFLTSIMEEFFYRAYLQNYLQEKLGISLAILFSSLFFALAHYPMVIFFFVPSLVFGILFWKFGLWPSILSHTTYNATILILVAKGYNI